MPQIEQKIKEIKPTRYSQCADCSALSKYLCEVKKLLKERVNRKVKPPDVATDLKIYADCDPTLETLGGRSSVVELGTSYTFTLKGTNLGGAGYGSNVDCPGIIAVKKLLENG